MIGQSVRRGLAAGVVLTLLFLTMNGIAVVARAAQAGTPTTLSCAPTRAPHSISAAAATTPVAPAADQTRITIGVVPVSIYAPVFVAKEKGYYAEQGLDVTIEPLTGGSDLIALTASNQFQIATAGAGPAFWNALALGLPIEVIAPGHQENIPVATPLMISRAACESGAITSVADLKGKRVSVNARGGTEYWLAAALGTGGLSLDDVTVETIPFPDAVLALQSGAIDAAMIGEPLATKAIQDGIAVPLTEDFPITDVLPTVIIANSDWAAANPELVTGFATAYLKASHDLSGDGWYDPANLAIIEQYTKVPAALAASAVQPAYVLDGEIDPAALNRLQNFFRERGQLEYETDLDSTTVINPIFIETARAALGTPTP